MNKRQDPLNYCTIINPVVFYIIYESSILQCRHGHKANAVNMLLPRIFTMALIHRPGHREFFLLPLHKIDIVRKNFSTHAQNLKKQGSKGSKVPIVSRLTRSKVKRYNVI